MFAAGVDLVPGAPPAVTDIPGAKGAMEATGSTVGSGADVVSDAGETVAAAPAGVGAQLQGPTATRLTDHTYLPSSDIAMISFEFWQRAILEFTCVKTGQRKKMLLKSKFNLAKHIAWIVVMRPFRCRVGH